MQIFHTTPNLKGILRDGFKDTSSFYTGNSLTTGVWFADEPLDCAEGAVDEFVLTLEIPDEVFSQFEWVVEGKRYREACLPAALVNQLGVPRLIC